MTLLYFYIIFSSFVWMHVNVMCTVFGQRGLLNKTYRETPPVSKKRRYVQNLETLTSKVFCAPVVRSPW